MYGMNRDHLVLLPHDPTWETDFASERDRLLSAIKGRSVRIEHVGSTSIPTVHAKPILDIAMLIDHRDLDELADALTLLGYKYRGPYDDEPGHYYAVLDRSNVRYCQLHIYTEPNQDWHCKLMFRDVLRNDLELAREYDAYKLSIANTAANKREYAEIKHNWLNGFLAKIRNRHGSVAGKLLDSGIESPHQSYRPGGSQNA